MGSEFLCGETVTIWNDNGQLAEVANMHWSTTACTVLAHLPVSTIAHELGHCFGLLRNGTLDVNNSSLAGTVPDYV